MGTPQRFTLDALSPCQVLSQSALLAELARAEDLADIRTDSTEASAMYATPVRSIGKYNIFSFEVPDAICTFVCVSQYSMFTPCCELPLTAMAG